MDNIRNSSISAIIELLVTHPLDYYKTLKQNNIKNIPQKLIKNPYIGIGSRLGGIVPMRIVFWSSFEYLKNKKCSSYLLPLGVSSAQTILDVPIEHIKINQMNNKKILYIPKNFLKGALYHYHRNILFAYGFYGGSLILPKKYNNPFLSGLIGGLIGSVISHPFDCLKTHYQTSNEKMNKFSYNFYIRGIVARSLLCTISMSVGYGCFIFLKNA